MTCGKCGISGDKNFYASTLKRTGHSRDCKTCHKVYTNKFRRENPEYGKQYAKKYRELNREKMVAQQKEWTDALRKRVFDHYGNSCACCGESERHFLTIDHINNDGHLFRTPSGKARIAGNALYSFIVKNSFPDDLQTLCSNCNFGKRRNKNICPHQEKNWAS